MKLSVRDLLARQAKGLTNRPDLVDKRPKGALFYREGSTGWGRVRKIKSHKGNRTEGDFSHLHDKFTEGDA